ncbi:MAG: hypothetical protein ABL982_22190 [Vicinamibacterales bacterium]
MDQETTVHELELAPGRMVALRELTSEEFEGLFRAVANDPNQNWELTQRGVRLSLIRDGATELEFKLLQGPLLAKRFSVREMLTLRQAWEAIHLPTPEDQGRVRAMRVAVG